jgi:predicted MFS family arabinose efflux permease
MSPSYHHLMSRLTGSIVCVGNVLVTNLVASDEQSVGGALFQTSYTVGFALGNNLSSLLIQRLGNDSGNLLQGLRASSGLNAACAWISEFFSYSRDGVELTM